MYHCKVPAWLTKLVKQRERRPGLPGGGRRPADGEGGRSKKITNPTQRNECKLVEGEQFKYLFHPGNIKSLDKPKNNQGVTLCMRYHTMGYCFKDCKYLKSHGNLNNEETVGMANFLATARQGRKKFFAGRGGGGGGTHPISDDKNKGEHKG